MTIDLLDVLAVDWIKINEAEDDLAVFHRRVVVAGVYEDRELDPVWRDNRGAHWAIARTERDASSTTIYFLPVG